MLELQIDAGIAHIRLSRPDKANALNADFWRDFPKMIDQLDEDPKVRVIVISGMGRHFCSGIDLAMLAALMPSADSQPEADPARLREKLRRKIIAMQDCFTSLDRCRKPSIAAVHGGCLGAGVDLVTACDIRLASADVRFTVQEINIGMVADVGTLQRIGHLLPHGIVRDLAYSGRAMLADEALRLGFISTMADDQATVIEKARAMAAGIAQKSPLAISGVKQVLNHARDHSLADGLDYIATWNAAMLMGPDLMKGAKAALTRTEADYDDLLD
ncbi:MULTISPECIES: crotonase/enoyl-CoA hydratase family protein [unclassified Iodidimonas]|jgi:enoyl-CoA hydratase|uniref:crotonase/enoyl-CoA hydratase family protein n=1 Tax=unclassified Iodidimonas TaxID=2626145 RepID=UPI0024824FD4|nr:MULTISPECIES: crotonase/enoyl-CoA hydratase family protein [unclassified Iodidimonas]